MALFSFKTVKADPAVLKVVDVFRSPTVLAYGNVSVTTTATAIRVANADRVSLRIFNAGSADLFIGNSAVTTANGMKIPAGQFMDLTVTDTIYGRVAAATNDVRWLEQAL